MGWTQDFFCDSWAEEAEDTPSLQRSRNRQEKYRGANELRVIKGEGTPATPSKNGLKSSDQTFWVGKTPQYMVLGRLGAWSICQTGVGRCVLRQLGLISLQKVPQGIFMVVQTADGTVAWMESGCSWQRLTR